MSYSNQVFTNNTSSASPTKPFYQLPRTIKPRDVERDAEGNVVVWNCFCSAIYAADRKRRQDQGLDSDPPLIQCNGRAWTNFDEYHTAHGTKTVICRHDGCFSCIPLQPGPINYHLSGDHATTAAEMTGETDPLKIQEALFKLPRLFYNKDKEEWVKDRPAYEKREYVPKQLDPDVPQITCTQDGCNEKLYMRKKDIIFHCVNKHLPHAASLLGLPATANKAGVQEELFEKDRMFFNKRSGSNGKWQLENPVKKPLDRSTGDAQPVLKFQPKQPFQGKPKRESLEDNVVSTETFPPLSNYSAACKKESVTEPIPQLVPVITRDSDTMVMTLSRSTCDAPPPLTRSSSVACDKTSMLATLSEESDTESEQSTPTSTCPPSIKLARKNRLRSERLVVPVPFNSHSLERSLPVIHEDTALTRTNEPLTLEEKTIARPLRTVPDEIVKETTTLEKFCSNGPSCAMRSNKTNPCRQNHVIGLEFLSEGINVPIYYCKWDYRWNRNQLGKRRRCANRECIYDHAEGHADYWTKKEKKSDPVASTEMECLRQELAKLQALILDKRFVNISESQGE